MRAPHQHEPCQPVKFKCRSRSVPADARVSISSLRAAARIQAIVVCVALALLAAPAARGESPIATLTAPTPISGGGGWIVWSAPTAGGWTLDGWHAGTTRVLALARRPQPFDASVGSDARGRPVVTFSRCRRTPKLYAFGTEDRGGTLLLPGSGAGCRLRLFELASGHERALAVPHPAGTSDTTPSMSHGVLVFARHARAHGDTWQVLLWSPRHRRRLVDLPHGAVPTCRQRLRRRTQRRRRRGALLSRQHGCVRLVAERAGPARRGDLGRPRRPSRPRRPADRRAARRRVVYRRGSGDRRDLSADAARCARAAVSVLRARRLLHAVRHRLRRRVGQRAPDRLARPPAVGRRERRQRLLRPARAAPIAAPSKRSARRPRRARSNA